MLLVTGRTLTLYSVPANQLYAFNYLSACVSQTDRHTIIRCTKNHHRTEIENKDTAVANKLIISPEWGQPVLGNYVREWQNVLAFRIIIVHERPD